MILLVTLLVALLLALATIMVRVIFNPKWAWLNRVIAAALIVSLVLGAIGIIGTAACDKTIDNTRDHYNTIMLYYDTIDSCRNEYVRFDFYTRVQEYNKEYARLVEKSENMWIGTLYNVNWTDDFGMIDFSLKTGNYYG